MKGLPCEARKGAGGCRALGSVHLALGLLLPVEHGLRTAAPPHPRKIVVRHHTNVVKSLVDLDSLVVPDDQSGIGGPGTALRARRRRQVSQMLHGLGLGKYAKACLDVPLRGKDLLHCTAEDLESIGFGFRPHRISLLEEIERFKKDGVPGALLVPDDGTADVAPAPPAAASKRDSGSASAAAYSETPTWLNKAAAALDKADAQSSAAYSETPSWLFQAKKTLHATAGAVDVADPPMRPPATIAAAAASAKGSSTQSLPSSSVDDLVGGLDGLRTAGGVSASDVLLHRLREQLEGTLGGLEMGMGEEGDEGEGGLAVAATAAARAEWWWWKREWWWLTQAIRSLEMGMGEGGGAGPPPQQQRQPPDRSRALCLTSMCWPRGL